MTKEKVIKVIDMGIHDYERRKVCICEGWDKAFIFYYFDDELSFSEGELIGKTEEEIWELKSRKDKAYLQS